MEEMKEEEEVEEEEEEEEEEVEWGDPPAPSPAFYVSFFTSEILNVIFLFIVCNSTFLLQLIKEETDDEIKID